MIQAEQIARGAGLPVRVKFGTPTPITQLPACDSYQMSRPIPPWTWSVIETGNGLRAGSAESASTPQLCASRSLDCRWIPAPVERLGFRLIESQRQAEFSGFRRRQPV